MTLAPSRVGLLLASMMALSVSCATPARGLFSPGPGEDARSVWVVGHEWHTGIVIRRADIPDGAWPVHDDFMGAEYLEVGWGDREFYQAPAGTVNLALRAAMGANPSVLHVVAFSAPVAVFFAGSEIEEIVLSTRGLAALCSFIDAAHARDPTGRVIALGPGLYGRSRFYLGRERYAFPETCNVWTARALRAAGLPITPALALTSHGVMSQVAAAARCARRP